MTNKTPKETNIVFMGTPDFAVNSLQATIKAGYKVCCVVTTEDKAAGRGRKIQSSAVKDFAITQNLPILQPTNLKDPIFLESLYKYNPDIQIVVAFRMLPKSVWQIPKLGTFNLHASLLPQYRGAAPIQWAIINGEKKTGLTTFLIDDKMDTGAILLQQEIFINESVTGGELYNTLKEKGAQLVLKTLSGLIKQNIEPKVQLSSFKDLKPAPKLSKENTRVQWDKPQLDIYNLVRALSPYPCAWTMLCSLESEEEKRIKITKTKRSFFIGNQKETTPGQIIIQNKRMWITTGDLPLEIISLCPEGKKNMKVIDFLNGNLKLDKYFFQ